NWSFEDHIDGSLYVVFDRLGKGPRMTWGSRTGNQPSTYSEEDADQKFRISYHPDGHIRFHNVSGKAKSIHCEPIYAITRKQPLAFISVPGIDSLTAATKAEPKDFIVTWPEELTGRTTFWIEIGPPNLQNPFELGNMPLASVRFDPWFALFISLGKFPAPIPDHVDQRSVIKLVPDQDFVTERVTREQAVIAFHQARAGVKHQAILFKNRNGEYRMVFAVPMRVPSELVVDFVDPDFRAGVTRRETYEIRFRVKGPGGYV